MDDRLNRYIPTGAISYCRDLLNRTDTQIKVVGMRVTRHGDYKMLPDGSHLITLNATPNPFRFLITLIHEIAHLEAFEKHGRKIKPHGKEWKHNFKLLMLPLLNPDVFPSDLLSHLAKHFKNPKASSTTDLNLALALKNYDPPTDKIPVLEIAPGEVFELYNGKQFRRGQKRVKRIECVELSSGKLYLFQPNAEVVLIKDK